MKRGLLLLFLGAFLSFSSYSQDCFMRLQKAFNDRGANPVGDDMHRNVIISFFEEGGTAYCVSGKARVENGYITSIFMQYVDGTYELMEAKFYNSDKKPPTIDNGISEMIYNANSEKFKIVFIDALKPKAKSYKQVELPDDL